MIKLKEKYGRIQIGGNIITLASSQEEIKRFLKYNPTSEIYFDVTKNKKDGKANKSEDLAKSKSKGSGA